MNEFIEIRNRIAALIEKYKYMLSRYDFLDEQKKNIINSCGNLDDDSVKFNLESVGFDLTVNDVRLLLVLIKLRFWLNKNTIKDYNDYINMFGVEETMKMLHSELDAVSNMLSTTSVYENLIKLDETKSKINYTENAKNLIIFLGTSENDYFIEDLNELLLTKRPAIKNLDYAFNLFSNLSISDIRKLGTVRNKKIKPSDGIINYYDELKPHRLRQNDVRVAYTQLSLTSKNKLILQQLYNNGNDINIILVVGFKVKSDDIYDQFNARISKEIYAIRQVKELFETDFTIEKLPFVDAIFNQTEAYLKSINSNQITK